nr:hypothetical protein [Janibacter limosus]
MTRAPQLHSPDPSGPIRHGLSAVRRPRRLDQHHAADHAEPGRRGHPPRPQPLRPGRSSTRRSTRTSRGVAVSSYRGGHVEYFEYLTQLLREQGAGHIKVFGGGGGVIVPEEISRLREAGVRIFSPEDGQRLGLPGMINTLIAECDTDVWETAPVSLDAVLAGERAAIARAISGAELGHLDETFLAGIAQAAKASHAPVPGLTGTGGSGKSSLTDELVRRFRVDQQDKLRIAVIAVDPTRRKGGGALLGDRIRMNSLGESTGGVSPVFFRSPGHPW